MVVQGNTVLGGSGREFLVQFGLNSNQGSGAINNLGDKVCLYTGINATSGSGDVWGWNPVMILNSGFSSSQNSQCMEVDFNNGANTRNIGNALATGMSFTGASSYNSLAACWVDAGYNRSTQWNNAYMVNGCTDTAFRDYSPNACSFQSSNTHSYGLYLNGTYANAAIQLPLGPNSASVVWAGAAGAAYDYCDTSLNRIIGQYAVNILHYTNILPGASNAYQLGGPSNYYKYMYATQFAVVSDPRVKTDIQPIAAGMLNIVKELNPITFKNKLSHDRVSTTRIESRPATEESTQEVNGVTFGNDDKAYFARNTETHNTFKFKRHVVHEKDGMPGYHHDAPDRFKMVAPDGTLESVPKIHHELVYEDVEIPTIAFTPRAGRRTHFGFSATEIGDVMAKHGLDFGGYQKPTNPDDNESYSLNQMTAVLWKAVQELTAEVEALKVKLLS
jgi:hypothetical protein